MPIITLENAGELSKEQKQLLIKRLTEIVAEITEKNEKYIYVRIDEVPPRKLRHRRKEFIINERISYQKEIRLLY